MKSNIATGRIVGEVDGESEIGEKKIEILIAGKVGK